MLKNFNKFSKSEFTEKVLDLRRVTRVVAGGKRFRFRATVVVGDEKGRVGVGLAKGSDVAQAVNRAKQNGIKNLFKIELRENRTIPYEVEAKYSAARVRLKPAKRGHGLIAGGACRVVLGAAGIKDISAKILGRTANKLTNAMATIEALKKLKNQSVIRQLAERTKLENNEVENFSEKNFQQPKF